MMRKSLLLFCSILLITCFSCQEQRSQNNLENTALSFSKAFYNLDYPEAKEWATPSSLSYLSFLASNVQQMHLDELKAQGIAEVAILTSQTEEGSLEATVICEIKNVLKINPINGNTEKVTSLLDTLQLTKEDGKWLVRKGIPQQSEKQNRD